MIIWRELQEQNLIKYGCLLKQGDIVSSCFPREYKSYLAVAKQSLSFIFRSVAKSSKGYDEAHLEVGEHHFCGFMLDADTLLICFYEFDMSQQNLRQYVEENRARLIAVNSVMATD